MPGIRWLVRAIEPGLGEKRPSVSVSFECVDGKQIQQKWCSESVVYGCAIQILAVDQT